MISIHEQQDERGAIHVELVNDCRLDSAPYSRFRLCLFAPDFEVLRFVRVSTEDFE